MANTKRIEELFTRYIQRQISAAELAELAELIKKENAEEELETVFQSLWNRVGNVDYPVDWETIWKRVVSHESLVVSRNEAIGQFDDSAMSRESEVGTPERARVSTIWKWIGSAAAVLIVGLGLWFFLNRRSESEKRKEIAKTDVEAPKATKAQITLADGRVVSIDSLNSLQQGDVVVVKKADGTIEYRETSDVRRETVYNTLSNPRGSKVVDLTLSDGTRVWLNSESSLRYPIAFVGSERVVEITGEAYFEVSPEVRPSTALRTSSKPFKVIANGLVIEDLGTEFNVNSYDAVKTTLVSGKVKIGSLLLKPGEQATSTGNGQLAISHPDLQEILAWKNNEFRFYSASLAAITQELERWYDVDVEIRDNISDHFTGVISRNVNVSEVFSMLQQTGALKVSIHNKKIIITK